MKTLKFVLLAVLFVGLNSASFAQKLLPGAYTFSKKEPVYITLTDGNQVEGQVRDIDRKKGLIKNVEITDTNGDIRTFRAEEIQYMYIAPSGWDKLGKLYDFLYDPAQWDNDNYRQDYFREGYVYFEQAEVEMSGKTRIMLMQLLNPSFSSKIKVYMDPFASGTASVGVGGFKMAGGDKKSYYVKEGNRTAFLLKKADYKDYFIALFGECAQMVPLKQKAKWSHFDQHVYNYTTCK